MSIMSRSNNSSEKNETFQINERKFWEFVNTRPLYKTISLYKT